MVRHIKIIFSTTLFVLVFFLAAPASFQVHAEEECSQACLEAKISDLQGKIGEKQQQANTLSNTISILNGQIVVQELQVRQTKLQIEQLTHEISDLGERISGLNVSLDQLTNTLIQRADATYKAQHTTPLAALLVSDSVTDFLRNLKYLELAQEHTTQIMKEAESQRLTFDQEKDLKQKKQAEVEQKKQLLQKQENELNAKRASEKALLDQTRNEEASYQQLLAQAQAQLAAFKGYVQSQGGASSLSGQTVCNDWGCYYNQRDSSWSGMIGGSNVSVAEAGCLISSSAMIASHYKKNLTPRDIASNVLSFSTPVTAYLNKTISVNGITISRASYTGSITSRIDGELSQGRPVIVGLYSASQPSHFIVLKSGSNGDYIMNDPFMENGHDVPLSVKYKMSDVKRVDIVTVN
jgi:peptidoglycan hydrolase CwlO-like protein